MYSFELWGIKILILSKAIINKTEKAYNFGTCILL